MAEITITDPFKGKKYSDIYPQGEPKPTHPLLKIAGTGKATWEPEIGRFVV